MSDFHLVDPQGWVYDLHSVYSAYMGYFQFHGLPWHDRTWGPFFETFEQFLAFSWPVITVTDARTGRAHIVTRVTSLTAFLKMIQIRFGETLPQVDNMFLVTPLETSQRLLRHINDWSSYKKLHSALPGVALNALKSRVRGGDLNAIQDLWAARDKTFLAIDFGCLERNGRVCTEWGYAAIRSSHLELVGAWPPVPTTNYRKGHYIVAEYADILNKGSPGLPRQYAFGKSQTIPKAKMPLIVQSILSGLVSPESDTVANNVVLVGHSVQALLQRLEDMKIKLPTNVLVLDIAYFERALFLAGQRGAMVDRKLGRARMPESMLSLGALLHSLGIDLPCALHNPGNDAFMALVAFQRMAQFGGGTGRVLSVHGAGEGAAESAEDKSKGKSKGKDKSKSTSTASSTNGQGHIKRVATVAARFFWPLGSSRSDVVAERRDGRGQGNEVDEMGLLMSTNTSRNTNTNKRASVLMVPPGAATDKSARRASQVLPPPSAGDSDVDKNSVRSSIRQKRASALSKLTSSPSLVPVAAVDKSARSARRASQVMPPAPPSARNGNGNEEAVRTSTRQKRASVPNSWTSSPLFASATDKSARRVSQVMPSLPSAGNGSGSEDEKAIRTTMRQKRSSVPSSWTSSPLFAPATAAPTDKDKRARWAGQVMQTRVAPTRGGTVDEAVTRTRASANPKRASMLGTWTSPMLVPGPTAATDKRAKRASQGSLSGSGMWLTSNVRRHSSMPLRNGHEGALGG